MALYIFPLTPVSITAGATEAKQDVIITELQDIETDIETTNTTLTSTNAKLDTANSRLTSLDSKDFSTSAKQDSVISELQDIETDVESVATTLAQRLSGSLAPVQYDQVVTTYVGSTTDIDTVEYKLAGVTVKTLTFTYDVSNRLTDVTAS